MNFHEKVRKLRKGLGLTQAELGEKAGFNVKSILKYEKASRPRNMEGYKKLATALNTDADYLFLDDEEDIAPKNEVTTQNSNSAMEEEIDNIPHNTDMSTIDEFVKDYFTSVAPPEQNRARGIRESQSLIREMTALFAGGHLSDEDKLSIVKSIIDAYVITKPIAQEKYTPKKYR